ncbi:MAG: pyridoxal phosphate-dependent aminotransferase family protein [Daejeonella sp.]|nr:pyridoxal phosphate-dependent aminotransferase family protein [Daejeonella sp.]
MVAFVILVLYYFLLENISNFISTRLLQRKEQDAFRTLKPDSDLIDFCSNDYLGFARSTTLRNLFEESLRSVDHYKLGSTGSRLLAGNDNFTEELESEIAQFHHADSALIYNSGYDANLGFFSSLPQRGDTIITDQLIHACIIDGARLSYANRYVFKHNDLSSLEEKLNAAKGNIFIAVESIYSMDGDEAPLVEICALAKKYQAAVIVDEAHATTIFGNHGRGLVSELNLENEVFARIITFGKGLGVHGAAILGTSALRDYLINFSRSFIYTTASPFALHLSVKLAYQYLQLQNHQQPIHDRIKFFRDNVHHGVHLVNSRSAIQAIIIGGNAKAKAISLKLQADGFDVRAILSPTVTEGSERLRICLHNHNTFEQIRNLTTSLNRLI